MASSIVVLFAAAIPVGHRVEVRWYRKVETKVFGGKRALAREYQPIIRDLDSGVEYCSEFCFGTNAALDPKKPLAVTADPGPHCELERVLEGKVVSCRVMTILEYAHLHVQTHLTIEPS